MRHVEASSLRRDVPNSRHGASFESLCLSSHKSTSHGTNSGEILMQSIQNNFLKIFTRLSLWLGNLLLRKIDCNLRSSIIITDRIQVTNCLKVKYSCSLANWVTESENIDFISQSVLKSMLRLSPPARNYFTTTDAQR